MKRVLGGDAEAKSSGEIGRLLFWAHASGGAG
jgi:hypothetical protein